MSKAAVQALIFLAINDLYILSILWKFLDTCAPSLKRSYDAALENDGPELDYEQKCKEIVRSSIDDEDVEIRNEMMKKSYDALFDNDDNDDQDENFDDNE